MTAPEKPTPDGNRARVEKQDKEFGAIVPQPVQRMSAAERGELGKLLRLRGKVAQADLRARGAEQLAIVEQQLSARYGAGHAAWAEVTAAAEAAVKAADAEIAERCKALGIPAAFRPGISLGWYSRGENAEASRRTELRMLAKAEIDARVKRAAVEVDRSVASLTGQLVAGAIQSADGRAFLDCLPSIDALLTPPSIEAIEAISANPAARRALGL